MLFLKRAFKRNSHNLLFKNLAGFGRSLNRLYENRNHDIYSNGEIPVIKKISQFKPSTIIDGGANIGKYSLLLSQFNPQAKIFAFEPVEDTYNKLEEVVHNHQNIIPIKKGLYSKKCTKEIHLFNSNTLSSIYDIKGISYEPSNIQSIDLIRGEDFIHENHIESIDFLKLDLEGAEYEALLGFEELFKQKRIKVVQFEYGYINISTKKLLVDYYAFFEERGYIVGKIFPKKVEFRKYQHKYEDFLGPNFIAINSDETQLIKMLANK